VTWRAHLQLQYTLADGRCTGRDSHVGPLRVLKALHPEGPAICHHVLVHPPGGVVGGDELRVTARLDPGTHAVLTTPGATRFYRSEGAPARQHVALHLADGARAEWLPLEAIAHSGCVAENALQLHLQPGAQALAWDVLALGLPASNEAFARGSFLQHLEVPGQWLERGHIPADDSTLLHSPLGLAGRTVSATLCFASGSAWPAPQREALLEAARAAIDTQAHAQAAPGLLAGATAPQPGVVLLRVLAHKVEPTMALLAAVRAAWRAQAWGLTAQPPRIWRT
jgi:urease accessory protein